MNRKTLSPLTLALALVATACNGASNNIGATEEAKAQEQGVAQLLSQQTGDPYAFVRVSTKDLSVAATLGVYQNQRTGEYLVTNWRNYSAGVTATDYFASNPIVHNLVASQVTTYQSITDANTSMVYQVPQTSTIFTDASSGQTFEDAPTRTKDLESYRASAKQRTLAELKGQLISQFGLSESRAGQVASLVNAWAKLSRNNELTSEDNRDFAVAALGADFGAFQTAYVQALKGDAKPLQELTAVAAKTNGISTEQAAKILAGFTR